MDWQDLAECQVQLPDIDLLNDEEYEAAYEAAVNDTSFIRKPDDVTAKRWERICAQCPVIEECYAWANDNDVTGVFAAGEWRE